MCFSPGASFTASIIIAAIGVATLQKVKFLKELPLASIPLLFASQQFVEGLLWLVLLKGEMPEQQYWLTQLYSGYAYVIWPLIFPLSIFLIETNAGRRNIMKLLILMGFGVAIYAMNTLTGVGLNARIVDSCIQYSNAVHQDDYKRWIYVITVCLPFFLSSRKIIRWIGVLSVITFSISYYEYHTAYISVWCFFAAILTGCIYFYFSRIHRNKRAVFSGGGRPVISAGR